MAQIIEDDRPTVVHEREVHEHGTTNNNSALIAVLVVLAIIVLALLLWRPWSGSSSGSSVNVTVPGTSNSGSQ